MGLVSPYKMNSGHNKYNKTVTHKTCLIDMHSLIEIH